MASKLTSFLDAPRREGLWKRKGVGFTADSLFALLAGVAGLLVLAVLVYMVVSTTNTAFPIFTSEGISFITGQEWDSAEQTYQILPFIYGTLITSFIALMIAVPVSLGIALFLTEYAPRWIARPVEYAVDLLAAVPSVIYGLWGVWVVLPLFLRPVQEFLARAFGWIPIFEGPTTGYSYFAAGVILAVMIIPIITSLSREVFRTVPMGDRHAAYAMGATRWEMIKESVIPRSGAGVVGACMLGLGRALGETIVVAMLCGGGRDVESSFIRDGSSIAGLIANNWGEASGTTGEIQALVGMGVVLFVITIVVNMAARALVWRFARRV